MSLEQKKKPNIVLIVADDLGCCDLGFYGNGQAVTPNIDRLASQGINLTNHYSGSPMCAPARAALQTGRYPHRTGCLDVASIRGLCRIAPDEVTIASLLKEQGYSTGLIGKWHNGAGNPAFHPCRFGYDTFRGFRGGASDYWDYELEHNQKEYLPCNGEYLTDRLTRYAIEFVEQHQANPFFLQIAYNAPHRPLQAPEENLAHFQHCNNLNSALKILYAMIERMDSGIGQLLDALHRYQLDESTIVIFVSDNGPDAFGEGDWTLRRSNLHLRGYKGDVLEGGIRVPAIARWSGHWTAGATCSALTHFTDWLPTLLEATGSEIPPGLSLDGQSILPLFFGGEIPQRTLCWHWSRYQVIKQSNAALRDGNFKLYYPIKGDATTFYAPDAAFGITQLPHEFPIVRTPVVRNIPAEDPAPQLFDLATDPAESTDVAWKYPDRVQQMSGQLCAWMDQMEREWQEKTKQTLLD